MAGKQHAYDREYKIQAVKLSKEIGGAKAAAELNEITLRRGMLIFV